MFGFKKVKCVICDKKIDTNKEKYAIVKVKGEETWDMFLCDIHSDEFNQEHMPDLHREEVKPDDDPV
jgi:hypothetical protein